LEAVKRSGPPENVLIGMGLKFVVTTGLTKLEVLLTRIALPGQALTAIAAEIAAKHQMVVTGRPAFMEGDKPRNLEPEKDSKAMDMVKVIWMVQ
jgi:hypothetical protein